jgi:hypothetical protein
MMMAVNVESFEKALAKVVAMFCTEMTGSWLGPGIREFDQDDGCRNAESQQKNLGVYNALWMKPARNISLIMRQSANAFSEETQAHRVHDAHSAATIPAAHVTLACQDGEGPAISERAGASSQHQNTPLYTSLDDLSPVLRQLTVLTLTSTELATSQPASQQQLAFVIFVVVPALAVY